MKIVRVAVVGLLAVGASTAASAQDLSLNRDLQRLGIGANLEANRRDLDARPLLDAAIDYVKRSGIRRVTLDPGDYYLLTPRQADRYLHLSGLRDVTFDFTGANLFFREAYGGHGLSLADCERVTFKGFTVDFLELPFTQVRVAQVRSEDRTLRFESISGHRLATDFNTIRGVNNAAPVLYGMVFRGGNPVADTGRFAIDGAIGSDTLRLRAGDYWTEPVVIGRYLPGDTLVIFGRGAAGTAIRVTGGSDVAFEDIEIYASNQVAFLMEDVARARYERNKVRPRPGTDRLISTNADGLHLGLLQGGSIIRNNEVRRTLDDGIAVNSVYLADVVSASGTRAEVRRRDRRQFETGAAVNFVNDRTAQELTGARIASQDPPFDAVVTADGLVRLQMDGALPALAAGFGMVFADSTRRGVNTVIEQNVVEDVLFARGIYVAGTAGVIVRNNVVRRTTSGGIVAYQTASGAFVTPPVRDLQVLDNVVEEPIRVGTIATGSLGALGGITVISGTSTGEVTTARANTGIVVTGNRVTGSGRSGIFLGNVGGGRVRGNTVTGHYARPNLPQVGVPLAERAQFEREFAQAIAVRSSDGVEVASNTASRR